MKLGPAHTLGTHSQETLVTTAPAPPPPQVHTEAQLEAIFRARVRLVLGGKIEKVAPTRRGMPDRLVLLPCNRIWLVELKTATGKLSPIQESWHAVARTLVGRNIAVLRGLPEIETWVRDRAQEYDHLSALL